MKTLNFTEDCIPHEIREALEQVPLKVRLSFIAILANTWNRQKNNNNQKII